MKTVGETRRPAIHPEHSNLTDKKHTGYQQHTANATKSGEGGFTAAIGFASELSEKAACLPGHTV
jgi:hypothetical protein